MTCDNSVARSLEIIGGVSDPSKMPCYGYSIPAEHCLLGSRLRDISGSTCSDCYARKGTYRFPSTVKAMDRRYAILRKALANKARRIEYIGAFAYLLDYRLKRQRADYVGDHNARYFRWHDSGDLQSVAHLGLIARVAELSPGVSHWLPTREKRIVRAFTDRYDVPDNLTIRLSDTRVDARPDITATLPTSGVHSTTDPGDTACPAPSQNGACGDCRRCWNRFETRISYQLH